MLFRSVAARKFGYGVMVTASHNPPDYNGFKFWDDKGAFRRNQEERLEELFRGKKFSDAGGGEVSSMDFTREHIDMISDKVEVESQVKVLVDCAGGAGSMITPKLLRELGCEVTAVNTNTDGVFPHPLEPTAENLRETCRLVREGDYDIGLVHDGDADRTAAIDRNGKLIEWDRFLSVLAWGKHKVVTTVDASMIVQDVCDNVVVTPVGDVAVAQAISKHKADFGGEPSGTYIFPEIHMYPDGVATAAKTVEAVSKGLFYSILEEIPSLPVERVKIPCPEGKKKQVMVEVGKRVDEICVSIDGLRVEYDDGWILVRPSGTEPYVRVTVEARDKKRLDELVDKGSNWVKESIKAV